MTETDNERLKKEITMDVWQSPFSSKNVTTNDFFDKQWKVVNEVLSFSNEQSFKYGRKIEKE